MSNDISGLTRRTVLAGSGTLPFASVGGSKTAYARDTPPATPSSVLRWARSTAPNAVGEFHWPLLTLEMPSVTGVFAVIAPMSASAALWSVAEGTVTATCCTARDVIEARANRLPVLSYGQLTSGMGVQIAIRAGADLQAVVAANPVVACSLGDRALWTERFGAGPWRFTAAMETPFDRLKSSAVDAALVTPYQQAALVRAGLQCVPLGGVTQPDLVVAAHEHLSDPVRVVFRRLLNACAAAARTAMRAPEQTAKGIAEATEKALPGPPGLQRLGPIWLAPDRAAVETAVIATIRRSAASATGLYHPPDAWTALRGSDAFSNDLL